MHCVFFSVQGCLKLKTKFLRSEVTGYGEVRFAKESLQKTRQELEAKKLCLLVSNSYTNSLEMKVIF